MQYLPTPSGPILDSTLKTVIENLASMEHHTPAQVDPLSDIQSITESMTARFQETLQVGQEPQKTFNQAFAHGMPKFLSPKRRQFGVDKAGTCAADDCKLFGVRSLLRRARRKRHNPPQVQ